MYTLLHYDTNIDEQSNIPVFYRNKWQHYYRNCVVGPGDKPREALWYNKHITIDRKHVFWKGWYKASFVVYM